MNNDLKSFYEQKQREEAKNVFYGEHDVISRPGFDSIEGFDMGIKDVKQVISDYDSLILENQAKLKEIVRDLDLYKVHPEIALPNEIEKLNNMYVSLIDKQKIYLEKQSKEKQNLEEIMNAKKEFVRETRFNYKSEAKDKVKFLDEYDAKIKEMKSLEGKIAIGEGNSIDKARYDTLKNDIIPEMEAMLGKNKEQKNDEPQNKNLENANQMNEQAENESVSKSGLNIPKGMNPVDLTVVPAKTVVAKYPLTVDELRERGGLEPAKKSVVEKIFRCSEKLKNIVNAVKEKFTSKKKDEVQSSDLDVNASDFAELNNITQEDLKNEFQNSGISR